MQDSPAPSAPPVGGASSSGESGAPNVTAHVADLILGPDDLPVGFERAAEDHSPDGVSVMYLRMRMPDEPAPDAGLFSVSIDLSMAADAATADAYLAALLATSADDMADEIRSASGAVSEVRVTPLTAPVPGADDSAAYRVRYAIEGVRIHEIRYRFRVRNVLGSLVAASRGDTDDEAVGLAAAALDIATRQVARVTTEQE